MMRRSMFQKYFTPEEANQLIPELEKVLERIFEIKGEAVEKALVLEELLTSPLRLHNRDLGRMEAFLQVRQELEFILEEIDTEIEGIQLLGCYPSDLDQGLVDFPALIGGKEAFLCWRSGEEQVGYWHGLDESYPKRKPLGSSFSLFTFDQAGVPSTGSSTRGKVRRSDN